MTAQQLPQIKTQLELGAQPMIQSHLSYEGQVVAVCHHSGQYLTEAEVDQELPSWLRVCHEFPGFPALDARFAQAAHAPKYHHWTWNWIAIYGLIGLVVGMVLAGVSLFFLIRHLLIANSIELPLLSVLTLATIGGVLLIIRGNYLLQHQNEIFHQQMAGTHPAIDEFPLFCTYHIAANEHITIDLGNTVPGLPQPRSQDCHLLVAMAPKAGCKELYAEYQRLYQKHPVGRIFNAGYLALEGVHNVRFLSRNVEFVHRVPLRQPISRLIAPNGDVHPAPTIDVAYELRPDALYDGSDEHRSFPFECVPALRTGDSYTLELHFRWRGDPRFICILDECALDIPPELQPLDRVEFGRYDVQNSRVIWRNLTLWRTSLVLRVTFGQPILRARPLLRGTYQCRLENRLLSGLEISPSNMWNVMGWEVRPQDVTIQRSTLIKGDLSVNTASLAHEHEYAGELRLGYTHPLDQALVAAALRILVRDKVEIQRVEVIDWEPRPSVATAPPIPTWDITGRRYELSHVDAIDIHIILSGGYQTSAAGKLEPRTYINVHARCLHDPHDAKTPVYVNTLLDNLKQEFDHQFGGVLLQRTV